MTNVWHLPLTTVSKGYQRAVKCNIEKRFWYLSDDERCPILAGAGLMSHRITLSRYRYEGIDP